MFKVVGQTKTLIEEKQLEVLRNFNRELDRETVDEHDPLDELLAMDLEQVFDLVKSSYKDYMDDLGMESQGSKGKSSRRFRFMVL